VTAATRNSGFYAVRQAGRLGVGHCEDLGERGEVRRWRWSIVWKEAGIPSDHAVYIDRSDATAPFEILRSIAVVDPRDRDPTRPPPFDAHNCARCRDGDDPCVEGAAARCSNLHARND
jgi:hypothetical protein